MMYNYSDEEKNDLIADTVLKVFGKLDQIVDNPQYYSLKVFRNKLGDDLRKRYGSRKVKVDIMEEEHAEYRQRREVSIEDLGDQPDNSLTIDNFEKRDFNEKFRRAIKSLKIFCQMMFAAMMRDRKDKLFPIFMRLHPGHGKSDFYVQTMRCRDKFKIIRKELEG